MPKQPSICEEAIYNELYKSYAEKIRNYVYYKSGDLTQAEDIMQETFLRLWKKCAEILFDKVGGFLHTVSNHLFIDSVRSHKVSLRFQKSHTPLVDSEDPFFHLRTKEFQESIEQTISNLPEGQREAFLMNRIDKLTYKEIAQSLGISQTAVEKRIGKALIKLKSRIEEFNHQRI
ncbi:MAG: RNA polymerase sigma factor [Bacteroidota bacterium]